MVRDRRHEPRTPKWIHGDRIELGEIESALTGDPGLSAAAVTVLIGQTGERRLVAQLRECAAGLVQE